MSKKKKNVVLKCTFKPTKHNLKQTLKCLEAKRGNTATHSRIHLNASPNPSLYIGKYRGNLLQLLGNFFFFFG
jgi:hypothetical protein